MLLRLLPPPLPLKTGLGSGTVPRDTRPPTSSSSLPAAAFIFPGPQQRESAATLQGQRILSDPSQDFAAPNRGRAGTTPRAWR
ncbi:hypothetical protein LUU34_00891200 [Aix galericulata]|nr:hypothetical protein LUU34_00891200 [Aix galericulata]